MSFASLISFIGASLIVIAFTFIGQNLEAYRFFEELPESIFKKILFIGYFIFGLALLCQPLYFRSIRTRLTMKFILTSLGCVILFFLTFLAVGKNGNYLDRSFTVYIFIIFLLSWMLAEVIASNEQLPTLWINLIRSATLTFIGIFLIWMVVIFIVNRQGNIWGFNVSDISQFDISARFLRGALFVFLQLIILMHWIENFSHNAIKVKMRDAQIQGLLQEKDILIENLSNKNALVETGALSAGLAHEFNQFLTRIELNSGEVLDKINRQDLNIEDLKLSINNILKANHSAADLVVSLKKLFQSSKNDTVAINLDILVEDVISLYTDRVRKSKIMVHLDLDAKEPIIVWDSLMRQVIANLVSNAIDALDMLDRDTKKIHIESRVDEDGWYRLSVSDNGLGVRPDQADKLFNLFATSKSSGVGIGLWLSYYIAERHQGTLSFENLPNNEGVTFFLSIPPRGKTIGYSVKPGC